MSSKDQEKLKTKTKSQSQTSSKEQSTEESQSQTDTKESQSKTSSKDQSTEESQPQTKDVNKPLLLVPGLFANYKHEVVQEDRIPCEIIIEQLHADKQGYYILSAGTGTGKSSAFVNELFKDALQNNKSVLVTQPRVVLCMNKMTDLPPYQKNLKPGVNLGYLCGNNIQLDVSEPQYVKFMTTEKFQQLCIQSINQQKDLLADIEYVAIDEAHDISEQMIFTLLVIREYRKSFPYSPGLTKFIFMSATIDINLFAKYYQMNLNDTNIGYIIPPKQTIVWNKDISYQGSEPTFIANFQKVLPQLYKNIQSEKSTYKHTLIFCSASMQIQSILHAIENSPPPFEYMAFPFMSGDSVGHTQNLTYFEKEYPLKDSKGDDIPDTVTPKFIVSTNLLEAGATIKNLLCVVDIGQRFYPTIDILNNKSQNMIIPISDSSKQQRIGRIGRNHDGYAIMLYPENTILYSDPSPIVLPNKLSTEILLRIIKLEIKNYTIYQLLYCPMKIRFQKYDLLQNISVDLLNKSICQLKQLQILDDDNCLSLLGVWVLQNSLTIPDLLLIFFGANLEQMCICRAIIAARLTRAQKLTMMDVLLSKYANQPDSALKNAMINVNIIVQILEQAFEQYISTYNRACLLPKEDRIFRYQEFKSFLIQADII